MAHVPFTCRFVIETVNTVSTGIYNINGRCYDNSTNEWNVNNIANGYVIYDESTVDGSVNRWKITNVINTGTPNKNSITTQVVYDDDGVESRPPVPSSGVCCEVTPVLRLSQIAWDIEEISDNLIEAIRADDNRRIDNISLGGGGTFTDLNPCPISLGGISAGTTFNAVPMQTMWQNLLYPYQYPAFSSFYINGQSTTLEIGATVPANLSFIYSTTNSNSITSGSISIVDRTLSTTLASGLNYNSSPTAATITPITNNAITTHTFGINGYNTQDGLFSASTSINWYWRNYYGASANPTLGASDILNLQYNQLSNTVHGTYVIPDAGYKYICICDSVPSQINSIYFGQFNVPLCNTSPYNLIDGGGFNYDLVNNVIHGGNYRVYRTLNIMNSSVTLTVS